MPHDEIVEELVALSHQVRRGGRRADARAKSTGGANGFVLRHLLENGCASPSELRDALGVTTPRVTAILNDLEQRGFIARRPSENDHRRVEVSLTDEGREVVTDQISSLREEISDLVEKIGDDDAKALARVLRVIAEDGSTLPF